MKSINKLTITTRKMNNQWNITVQYSSTVECSLETVTMVYLIIIYIMAMIGNTMILAVAWFNLEFRTGGMLPMFTLSLFDMSFAQMAILSFLLNMNVPVFRDFNVDNCAIFSAFGNTLACCAINHHSLLAVTRYVAICYPTKYKTTFTTKRMAIILICTISLIVTLNFLTYMLPTPNNSFMQPYYNPSMLCCIYSSNWQVILFVTMVFYGPPMQIASFCYIKCVIQLRYRNHNKTIKWLCCKKLTENISTINNPVKAIDKKQQKLASIMIINYIVVNFNCCLYPVAVLINGDDTTTCNMWKRFLSYFILHNSVATPVVYLILSKKIRNEAIRIFTFNKIDLSNDISVIPTMSNNHMNTSNN